MDKKHREEYLKAIEKRHSVRRYKPDSLPSDIVSKLEAKIAELNSRGGLNMQLVTDEPKGFSGFFAYGQFSGVMNYIVVAGKKDETFGERVGYCGEELVLFAQLLGLNTCWAGLSYRKVPGTFQLGKDEKISCYIAIGYGLTQGATHKIKTPNDVSNVGPETPEWFLRGVEAALLAPTAINQQKFSFKYIRPNNESEKAKVLAAPGFSLVGYTKIDLGIAKLHFEIGASKDNFDWV